MTKTQRKNLIRLALGLPDVPPKQFDMGEFESHCGTSACALGWAPWVIDILKRDDEFWEDYSSRVVGVDAFGDLGHACFAGSWGMYENTPRAAAARILYALEHPEEVERVRYRHKFRKDFEQRALKAFSTLRRKYAALL